MDKYASNLVTICFAKKVEKTFPIW